MKKLLSTILIDRSETVEFRAIRRQLMTCAQNNKREYSDWLSSLKQSQCFKTMESKSKKSKSTTTKSGCVHGSPYWLSAAKMIPYEVNHTERSISVPEPELDVAAENLTVRHMVSGGYHIQSCIPSAPLRVVFDPDIRLKQAPPKPVSSVKYPEGTVFLVQSDGVKLCVAGIDGVKYTLQYLNRNKPDITVQEKDIDKSVSWSFWIRQ